MIYQELCRVGVNILTGKEIYRGLMFDSPWGVECIAVVVDALTCVQCIVLLSVCLHSLQIKILCRPLNGVPENIINPYSFEKYGLLWFLEINRINREQSGGTQPKWLGYGFEKSCTKA